MPKLDGYRSTVGFYVGTYCDCSAYTRKSGHYPSRELAEAALQTGAYGRWRAWQLRSLRRARAARACELRARGAHMRSTITTMSASAATMTAAYAMSMVASRPSSL